MMLGARLSNLRPTAQLEDRLIHDKKLTSQVPVRPTLPTEDSEEPDEQVCPVMTETSKMSQKPSYDTYHCLEELHPSQTGKPDRGMHNIAKRRLHLFLKQVARSPKELEEEVEQRRSGHEIIRQRRGEVRATGK